MSAFSTASGDLSAALSYYVAACRRHASPTAMLGDGDVGAGLRILLTHRIVVYTIIVEGEGSMERKDESLQAKAALIVEECIAVKLRMLTRAVTKIYNRALRPHGLTVSQMNILVAASYIGQAKQQDICQALHLEKSTLSRDLARMRERGWVAESPGDDGRSSLL